MGILKRAVQCVTILFILAFVLLNAALAAATTYYVDIQNMFCSDTNPSAGTQAMPWCTVNKAVSSLHAGDTCYVAPGVYSLGGTVTPAYAGTAALPVRLIAQSTAASIIGKGNSPSAQDDAHQAFITNGLLSINKDYWTVQGFYFRQAGGVESRNNRGFILQDSLIFVNPGNGAPVNGGSSVTFYDSDDSVIDHVEIWTINFNAGWAGKCTPTQTNGLFNVYYSSNVVLRNSLLYGAANNHYFFDSDNFIVENNIIFYGQEHLGGPQENTRDWTYRYNIFSGTGQESPFIATKHCGEYISNGRVYNNLALFILGPRVETYDCATTGMSDLFFRNNLEIDYSTASWTGIAASWQPDVGVIDSDYNYLMFRSFNPAYPDPFYWFVYNTGGTAQWRFTLPQWQTQTQFPQLKQDPNSQVFIAQDPGFNTPLAQLGQIEGDDANCFTYFPSLCTGDFLSNCQAPYRMRLLDDFTLKPTSVLIGGADPAFPGNGNIGPFTLEDTPIPQPPVADFSFTPSAGTVPLNVQFTDLSADSDGTIVSWAWDFQNNGVVDSTLQNPSHIFSSATTYTVKLTVTDNDGLTGTVTKQLVVSPAPAQPSGTLPMMGDLNFDPDSLSPEMRTWYDRMVASVAASASYVNTRADSDDLFVLGRNVNDYTTALLFALRATGDLQFLDRTAAIWEIARADLGDYWCDPNSPSQPLAGTSDGYLNWRWRAPATHPTYGCKDTHSMDEAMTHGTIALVAYALDQNRAYSQGYAEKADFWESYLESHFLAKWYARSAAAGRTNVDAWNYETTGFYKRFRHPVANEERLAHYLYYLTENPFYLAREQEILPKLLWQLDMNPSVPAAYRWKHQVEGTDEGYQQVDYAQYFTNVILEMNLEGTGTYAQSSEMQKYMSTFRDAVFTGSSPWPTMADLVDGSGSAATVVQSLSAFGRWDSTHKLLDVAEARYQALSANEPGRVYIAAGALYALSNRVYTLQSCVAQSGDTCTLLEYCPSGFFIPASDTERCCDQQCVACDIVDTDCDGTIENDELSAYISTWFDGQISIDDVIGAIERWKGG
ncbi:MAG: PKD domain-containing protein [Nanoarchaeota archaeon]